MSTYPLRPVMSSNARPPRVTAAAGTELTRASLRIKCHNFFIERVLQRPSSITQKTLLDQAFAHCPIFHTAASMSSGLLPVPLWLINLSDQLKITG